MLNLIWYILHGNETIPSMLELSDICIKIWTITVSLPAPHNKKTVFCQEAKYIFTNILLNAQQRHIWNHPYKFNLEKSNCLSYKRLLFFALFFFVDHPERISRKAVDKSAVVEDIMRLQRSFSLASCQQAMSLWWICSPVGNSSCRGKWGLMPRVSSNLSQASWRSPGLLSQDRSVGLSSWSHFFLLIHTIALKNNS